MNVTINKKKNDKTKCLDPHVYKEQGWSTQRAQQVQQAQQVNNLMPCPKKNVE